MGSFGGSDSWVLLSILVSAGRGTAGLRDILSSGDYINHAIFNYEELRGGLSRLLRAGLIRQRPGGWSASIAAVRAGSVRGRGFEKQFAALDALLEKTPIGPSRAGLRGVTRKTYEAACQAYAGT